MFRILIADRQDDLLWGLRNFLLANDRDAYVCVASSGEEAVKHLKSEPFDLLVTEVKLHGAIDGFELLNIGRDLYPELRLVLTSTLRDSMMLRLGRRIDADVLLQKPFSLKRITDAIQYVRKQQLTRPSRRASRIGLAALVETLCGKRLTGLIRMRNDGRLGVVSIEHGHLQHAEFNGLTGSDAFNSMIALNGGEFQITYDVATHQHTIFDAWETALRKARNALQKKNNSSSNRKKSSVPMGFGNVNDSMVSSVVSRTQRVYRDFPILRENADEFVRRCPGVLAYGLVRLNEVFSLSFQMRTGQRDFSDSQLIAYLDQVTNVTRKASVLLGQEMTSRFSIQLDNVTVVMERIYQSKYAQVVVIERGQAETDFVNLLMTQMGANYSLALAGIEK